MQLEHIDFLEVLRHLADTKRLSEFRRVVLVYNEAAVDIDQQQRILVLVGDRVNADPLRQLNPFSIRQNAYPVPGRRQISFNTIAVVIRQEEFTFSQHRKGGDIQMVRVAMREPVEVGTLDRLHLRRRDFVVLPPTAEIGVPSDPRIGCEHRPIIIGNHDGATDRLEEPHSLPPCLKALEYCRRTALDQTIPYRVDVPALDAILLIQARPEIRGQR